MAFTLPLNKKLIPPLIIITFLFWLIEGNFKARIQQLKNPYFILSISFFLLHIIGLLYSSNLKAGTFDIEQKLALLLFPILMFSISLQEVNQIKLLKSFLWGCVFAGFICLANAFYKYYNAAEIDSFFYFSFSAIMHASYFALYMCFAIVLLLFHKNLFANRFISLILLVFFIGLIILISSKSGIISLIFIFFIKVVYDIFIQKKLYRSIAYVLILTFSAVSVYKVFPKTLERFHEMKGSLTTDSKELNSTGSRIAIWKHAIHVISNNFLIGVGTGDVKDELKIAYKMKGESILAEKQLNAHNQYLQTFIALGLPGILVLLSLLIAIVYFTIKTNQLDGALLCGIIALNLLFESMLETQAGVVFIAFFLMLYFSMATQKMQLKNTNIAT